jgi:hypothetical protein
MGTDPIPFEAHPSPARYGNPPPACVRTGAEAIGNPEDGREFFPGKVEAATCFADQVLFSIKENFPQVLFRSQIMTNQYSTEVNDQRQEVQSLSDFHIDYIRRWMEFELLRQQSSSDRFLKERANARTDSKPSNSPEA